jgi:hypothetical protein
MSSNPWYHGYIRCIITQKCDEIVAPERARMKSRYLAPQVSPGGSGNAFRKLGSVGMQLQGQGDFEQNGMRGRVW